MCECDISYCLIQINSLNRGKLIMQVNNMDDLIRAHTIGHEVVGRIGLFGRLTAYRTKSEFDKHLKEVKKGLREDQKLCYFVANICDYVFRRT